MTHTGIYLNKNSDQFKKYLKNKIFVDKSLIIKETNDLFGSEKSFMCVTRPRRFGKTLALSMLNAYYSKGCDSKDLFKGLKISKDPSFEEHLNKHNVISVDMASFYSGVKDKSKMLGAIEKAVVEELRESFPSALSRKEKTIAQAVIKINKKLGERFIFLIDEWDVIFRLQEDNQELCDSYTEFLWHIFKSSDVSSCFDLVYMTGILPIRRYITQSTLNMFSEYSMLEPRGLASLFGFTEDEVKKLCAIHSMDFSIIKNWYEGYELGGMEIYNPKSVVEALTLKRCGDYWTATSSIEAITDYMNYDHGVLKGEITKMLSGGKISFDPGKFSNDLTKVDSKDAALTVLVHLGYLAYLPGEQDEEEGACYIPNEEIRREFERALEKLDWSGIYDPIFHSERLLKDTLAGDTDAINKAFDRNHRELASPFSKNDENVLSVIAIVSYYKARNHYSVRKEETSMNGRSDISFFPKEAGYPPFIVELKAGHSHEEAIEQIKERRYWEAWDGYKGKVLLVGINYDEKTLKHSSKTEWIEIE